MIRKAYLEMAKNYHPDRFHELRDAAIEEKAAVIFRKINEAYAILSSDDPGAEAAARPAANSSGAEWAAGKRAEQAKLHYRKGRYWMNRGEYRRAAESFRGAVELGPEEAEYNGWFADALERTGRMLHLAEEHCKKAIALDPDRAEHYVRLGRIYRRGKLDRRAEDQFRRALRIDSQNGEAKHELGMGKPVDRERGLMAAIIRTAASLGGPRARVDARAA
jgi:tetratricopeptide (TPR) repeat protein